MLKLILLSIFGTDSIVVDQSLTRCSDEMLYFMFEVLILQRDRFQKLGPRYLEFVDFDFELADRMRFATNMAVTTTLERAEDRDANDELTDQQIEELLTQATARLQAKAVSSAVARPSEQQRYKFPKLETGKLDKPYISTENNVAILDKSVLRSEQMREQSKGIRRVEDPALLKKAVEEVCEVISCLSTIQYNEEINIPKLSRADPWAPLWHNPSSATVGALYHSYSETFSSTVTCTT